MEFETISRLLIFSAIVVYALAFVIYAFDIVSHGSSAKAAPARANRRELVTAGADAAGGQSQNVSADESTPVISQAAPANAPRRKRRNWLRAGFSITVIGWVLHVAGTVLRGVAAERVPWANMYEFALTGIALAVGVFVFAQLWRDVRFLGVYIMGMATLFLGGAASNYYVEITPLPPALQSPWLVIHVFVATLACGFLAISSGLSIVQLIRQRAKRSGFIASLPNADSLENTSYRLAVVGFILWTFTLMAGAIWAHAAWGRYWGWDTKEVWTFIIWVVYAGYLHARATRGWRGTASAVLNLIGFAAILFNFVIVNTYFTGLHAYSGL
ncbi:c-type cytochrome biogenesis protein CcsB [Agrococcus casei]|uniref:Cytochrome c-type biogenesis protein CcsA/ResC n=1 Tax=Agrococcus casei LMG 22410 TaxID=1255656 RepID=A0A1R4G9L3_9MICO|nr:c-type cytochrome biogenesis protein CcsB [Agrococcus casei]SJM64869.1 Cytochrome c-type biogenesis protein CcsA/ResC [Agrococcus casei LMG 22410]